MATEADTNLTAVLHGKLDLRMEDRCIPEPGPGEVLVEMSKCGLCGTDLHLWLRGGCGDFQPEEPVVIGHETSGTVHRLGAGVRSLGVGDRVALELGLPCRRCDNCRGGRYNLCKPVSLGGLTRYHAYAADFCHRLPEHVTDDVGALIEPLAVAVRACRRGGVTVGSKVFIGGAGPIGLSCLLVCKALGAAVVCVSDLLAVRIDLARRMSADHTIHVGRELLPSDLAKNIVVTLGVMPDQSIETSGAESSLQAAILATRSGGVMVAVGLDPPEVRLPVTNAAMREVDIRGTFSYGHGDYPAAVAMVTSGQVDPTPMITHRFDLADTIAACELARTRRDGVVKIMVNCKSSRT